MVESAYESQISTIFVFNHVCNRHMKEYFLKLLRFNQWANELICTFLEEKNLQDRRIIRLMSHIVLAQENWYKRTIGQQRDNPVWDLLSLADISSRLRMSDKLWVEYIEQTKETDFQKILSYNNMAGAPNLSSLEDISAHLVNHGSYHRGQVVYLIRELDITPPSTDYIRYARLK
jgi:uncharacterized damage-inducible protein DinB